MKPDAKELERIIAAALAEDIGKGDVTAKLLVPESAVATLAFVNREPIVACGVDIVAMVFDQLLRDYFPPLTPPAGGRGRTGLSPSPRLRGESEGGSAKITTTAFIHDGDSLPARTRMIEAQGPARAILTAERTALNLLQRGSAVATLTARYVEAVRGTKAVILDTRKTMPGLRELDKYAVRTGGGRNHRMRLDDGILVKDNHIALAGSVREALKRAIAGNSEGLPLEIECDTLAQVEEALSAGAKALLLDNMTLEQMRDAVRLSAGRATCEASGNVNLESVRAIAESGVDFISVGRLTHSAPNVDIGLDISISS